MQLFFHKHICKLNQLFEIEGQENVHLSKVLRRNVGDEIKVTNGKGQLFNAEIISINKKKSSLRIQKELKIIDKKSKLSIAIAPTKNIARIEWFIEKSVEIGINDIRLFTSSNSERRNVNLDRLEKKSLSAMKQSLKTFLPKIYSLEKFEIFLKDINSENYGEKLIAYCEETTNSFIKHLDFNKKTIIVIGPEGGFSKEEIALAKQFNFKSVSLGGSRLRTETAGIFACSVFNSLKK